MIFKSCCLVSIQFFHGHLGFLFVPLISQCTACLDSLLSSIHRTCPSHLNLLSFMMRYNFSSCVCTLIFSLLILSFHVMLMIRFWNLSCVAFSFVQLLVAAVLHRVTLWTSLTTHTISLWVWCWYACSTKLTLFSSYAASFANSCLAVFVNCCCLSHSCPENKIPQPPWLQCFLFGFIQTVHEWFNKSIKFVKLI